jgi:alpha-L-fucosidase
MSTIQAWIACAILIQNAVDAPAPVPPLPSPAQQAWHERSYYAFVHFNMNTFTDREWGEGNEDPALFQPAELDCRQWVRAFHDAGMSGVILTVKHHDGFCLWPSKWSEHTVAHSTWREGKGDVVRELADACREAGLWMGVYLSPWDRNHPAYGDSPRYDEVFRGQLEELLTHYGEIAEVWFDGACGEGPNGKKQIYDWPSYVEVVRRCQPGAVIFSDAGPDVRWVGNEQGFAGETNWCTLRRDEFFPGTPRFAELTSGHEDGTHWVPAECDVSIRPGWYWHEKEDEAQKSVDALLAIWEASVGRNASLLLNVPADSRGRIPEQDAARLLEFRRAREAIYGEDQANGARVTASNVRGDDARFAATGVLDADRSTYWATDDGVTTGWIELELERERHVDRVVLEETIQLGQRVRAFSVLAPAGNDWQPLARGTTVGARRTLAFQPVRAKRLRIQIDDARGPLAISRVALHCKPPSIRIEAPAHAFLGAMDVHLSSDFPDAELRFLDLDPLRSSRLPSFKDWVPYEGVIHLTSTRMLHAVAFVDGKWSTAPAAELFTGYTRESLLDAVQTFVAPKPGLSWRYYEGSWQAVPDFGALEPAAEGVTEVIDLTARRRDEDFALEFSGFVRVPEDGIWTFHLSSDDGSRLEVQGRGVVDDDGLHGMQERKGELGLKQGLHPIRLQYFNAQGAGGLALEIEGSDGKRRPIPADWLVH